MTTALTGLGAAPLASELPPPSAEPRVRSLWGLLTVQVQAGADPGEVDSPYLEAALRMINGTEIGAALLREIEASNIPAGLRPVIALDGPASPGRGASTDDDSAPDDYIIHFTVEDRPPSPAETPADPDAECATHLHGQASATDLFADLVSFLAYRTGRPCLALSLGFGDYSSLTFREQLGDKIPQWQYSLEAYVRTPGKPDEDRAAVWETVQMWHVDGHPDRPLLLDSLKLHECPPLREVPGLTWLVLVGNALTAFPSRDQLPPTLTRIDLAGNPIVTPADSYGAQLRHVTLDRTVCENTALRASLPANVELVEADAEYTEMFPEASEFMTAFPETLVNMVPVEAMERAGWSNDVMGRLYPKDMLEKAAATWLATGVAEDDALAPEAPGDAWRRAQQADPNGASALTALLNRLHDGWLRQPNPAFGRQIVALLTKMCSPQNAKFLRECLSIAREGAASCDDQILYTLNNLHIASLNADVEAGHYDKRPVELMHHAEDMLNVHTLTQFFAELRPTLQQRARDKSVKFDEVEQWLHLHTRLQRTVHLPAMQFAMRFAHLSLVNDTDAEAARLRIRHARDTRFLDFLASWSPLQSVIRRTLPGLAERAGKWRDHIFNDRGKLYSTLDRMMKTDGQLFALPDESGMSVFSVGPRMFWTRYERLIDKRLAAHALSREIPDVLPRACRAVADEIQAVIQRATVRDYLNIHGLKLQQAIQDTDQPRWFKRLRKSMP